MTRTNLGQSVLRDRQWLEGIYLPSLAGSVLYVGVRWYNAGYQSLVQNTEQFETVDIDPQQAKYGSSYRHHVGSASEIAELRRFDHVAAYGLFGMPDSYCHDPAEITALIQKLAASSRQTFLYGASTDTMSLDTARRLFDAAELSDFRQMADLTIKPSPQHSEIVIRWVKRI